MDGGSGAANEYARVHGKVTNASKENTMIKAFKEIETMCQRIGLNKLVGRDVVNICFRCRIAQNNCLKRWTMRNYSREKAQTRS
jgi:hypothetical protein